MLMTWWWWYGLDDRWQWPDSYSPRTIRNVLVLMIVDNVPMIITWCLWPGPYDDDMVLMIAYNHPTLIALELYVVLWCCWSLTMTQWWWLDVDDLVLMIADNDPIPIALELYVMFWCWWSDPNDHNHDGLMLMIWTWWSLTITQSNSPRTIRSVVVRWSLTITLNPIVRWLYAMFWTWFDDRLQWPNPIALELCLMIWFDDRLQSPDPIALVMFWCWFDDRLQCPTSSCQMAIRDCTGTMIAYNDRQSDSTGTIRNVLMLMIA